MLKKRALWYRVILLLLALLVLGAFNWWYTAAVDSYRETDFSNFWLAGHMIAAGQNPYSTGQWKAALAAAGAYPFNTRFQYPPWSAVLLAPLGVLPFHLAITLFLLLTELSIVGIFWLGKGLVAWREHPRVSLYLFALIPLCFRPVLITLIIGQTSLIWLLVALVGIWLITTRKDFWGALLLASLLFKPQLALFPLLAVAGWACWVQRWAIFRGLAVGIGALLVLSAPLLVVSWSAWVQEIVGEKAQDIQVCPTVWGLVDHLLAPAGPAVISRWYYPLSLAFSLLIMGGSIVLLYRIHRQRLLDPHTALLLDLSVGLIVSVTVIPYAHSYDQAILLLPFLLSYALTRHASTARPSLARLLRWALVGAVTILPALLFVLAQVVQTDDWSVIEPVALLLLLVGACLLIPARPAASLAPAADWQAEAASALPTDRALPGVSFWTRRRVDQQCHWGGV